jgi:hypothetical protein
MQREDGQDEKSIHLRNQKEKMGRMPLMKAIIGKLRERGWCSTTTEPRMEESVSWIECVVDS